jgi:hypothetical protein
MQMVKEYPLCFVYVRLFKRPAQGVLMLRWEVEGIN